MKSWQGGQAAHRVKNMGNGWSEIAAKRCSHLQGLIKMRGVKR